MAATTKTKGRASFGSIVIDGLLAKVGLKPTAKVTAAQVGTFRVVQRQLCVLTNEAIALAAADDTVGVKLFDLPNTNLIFVGANIDLAGTVASFQTNTGANLDFALGSAQIASASTTFAGTNEKNLIPKTDATGGAGVIAMKGTVTATEILKLIAAGASNAVWLNLVNVTNADGIVTLSGTVELYYVDIGIFS